jgi:hypothetical protein
MNLLRHRQFLIAAAKKSAPERADWIIKCCVRLSLPPVT